MTPPVATRSTAAVTRDTLSYAGVNTNVTVDQSGAPTAPGV